MFTKEQQRLLYEASSKVKADDFIQLPEDMVEEIMDRIDKVMVDLHMQNPNAFLTTLKVNVKGDAKVIDNKDALKKRKFFDIPKSLSHEDYAYAVNPSFRVLRKVRK